jgi:hypothetical protein
MISLAVRLLAIALEVNTSTVDTTGGPTCLGVYRTFQSINLSVKAVL